MASSQAVDFTEEVFEAAAVRVAELIAKGYGLRQSPLRDNSAAGPALQCSRLDYRNSPSKLLVNAASSTGRRNTFFILEHWCDQDDLGIALNRLIEGRQERPDGGE
jgi:hypothetical protein